MRIGIHVRGFQAGKPVAVARALERGAETIQIFASNPRGWKVSRFDTDADRAFVRQMREHDVGPLFIHAPYLVNLASPSAEFRRRSVSALRWAMERALALRAVGVVVHAGSAGSRRRGVALRGVARAAGQVLGEGLAPALILELTSGGAGSVASRLEEAAEVLDACDGYPRLRFCLDTCHLHAAGYDLRSAEGVAELMGKARSLLGARRIALIHANDSRDP
ncbi:MAG: TIM barrel protein, partial [Actinomycetota bacterium]